MLVQRLPEKLRTDGTPTPGFAALAEIAWPKYSAETMVQRPCRLSSTDSLGRAGVSRMTARTLTRSPRATSTSTVCVSSRIVRLENRPWVVISQCSTDRPGAQIGLNVYLPGDSLKDSVG